MRQRHSFLALLILLFLTAPGALASKQASPRICLALGGGGARGFAHIGVLRWLEEARIPVHCIAGTSMGGLIGGLYAMGLTPTEILEIVQDLDWKVLFEDRRNFRNLSFRRKEDDRDFPNRLQLGWKEGPILPSGLVSGESIQLLFDHLTLPYSGLQDFDDLPIPYRSVSVDLVSANKVSIGAGSLSQALRATMSIPGIFQPLETDQAVLVDGGLLENLPSETARSMGADIVIAVDVTSPLQDRDRLISLLSVLDQALTAMILENVRASRNSADIVLAPDLEDFTSGDFQLSQDIAQAGYENATQKTILMQSFALDEQQWQAHLSSRSSRRLPRPRNVSGLVVASHENPKMVKRMESELENVSLDPLDQEALEESLNRIGGWGRFEQLRYSLGEKGMLQIDYEKSGDAPLIRLGFTADNAEPNQIRLDIHNRVTFLDLGRTGSQWRIDTTFGSNLLARSEFYQPLARGFFAAPLASASRSVDSLYSQGERRAEYKTTRAGGGFDLGWGVLSRKHEVRAGYLLEHATAGVQVGDPLLPSLSGTVSRARILWNFDGQDDPSIPIRGLRVRAEGAWYFKSPSATSGFPRAQLSLSYFHPISTNYTLLVRGAGGTTFGKTAPDLEQFTLGGPFRLGAFGEGEFRGSRFLHLSSGILRTLGELPLLLGDKFYLAGWHELGTVFERGQTRDYRNSITAGLLAETFVGPIFAGGSLGDGGHRRLYFTLGSTF